MQEEPKESIDEILGLEKEPKELSSDEFEKLSPEIRERYSVCHPNRCPFAGFPMPHSPHVPLYPSYWC